MCSIYGDEVGRCTRPFASLRPGPPRLVDYPKETTNMTDDESRARPGCEQDERCTYISATDENPSTEGHVVDDTDTRTEALFSRQSWRVY